MGLYINPPFFSKEEFLNKFGIEIDQIEFEIFEFNDTTFPICLVDNGPFTAAGVAYNGREIDAFLYPDDRPKRFYLVKKEDLFDETKSGISKEQACQYF